MRALRRLLLLAAVAAVALILWRRRRPLPTGTAPVWPPLDVVVRDQPSADTTVAAEPTVGAVATVEQLTAVAIEPHLSEEAVGSDASATSWVVPVDGECPPGFPVKVNVASGIFHVPGGRSYARTKPERCYATPDDAEADGFRRAKL